MLSSLWRFRKLTSVSESLGLAAQLKYATLLEIFSPGSNRSDQGTSLKCQWEDSFDCQYLSHCRIVAQCQNIYLLNCNRRNVNILYDIWNNWHWPSWVWNNWHQPSWIWNNFVYLWLTAQLPLHRNTKGVIFSILKISLQYLYLGQEGEKYFFTFGNSFVWKRREIRLIWKLKSTNMCFCRSLYLAVCHKSGPTPAPSHPLSTCSLPKSSLI